ncbi:MFS transporter [Desulfobacterota bacterium AH_259_B03_O07]|nr:MFS transporter [Desulfobacterota bacterium AH_259_B03_O07]
MDVSNSSRKWWALAGLSISSSVATVDFTIVNTALPSIQKDLTISFVELQWVMNIFVLTLSIFMVNMGRFGDIFGRRLMLYIGLVVFGLSSLFAGISPNGLVLIIFRAIQGIAVSIIIPSSLALVSSTFTEKDRGRAIGIWTSVMGLGLAIGPVLGGVITSALSWRWVFFVNIPVVIIASIICLMSVKETVQEGERKIDWFGFILMIIGLGTLVTAVIQGPEWGWGSAISIILFIAAIGSLIALYLVESRVSSPNIDFALFANSGFLSGALANFALISFAYSAFFLMPLFLRNIIGKEPYEIGLFLLPITVMIVIVAPIAGRIVDAKGAKLPILMGLAALVVTGFVQSTFKDDSSIFYILFGFIFMGIGWGFIYGSGAFAAISSLPQKLAGTATGALWTIQNLGGSIGLAIAGVIFRHRERGTLEDGLTSANVHLTRHQEDFIGSLLSDPDQSKHILSQFTSTAADKILPIFENAFMKGYSGAFLFLLCLSIATFIIILLMMKDIKRESKQ